MRRNSIGFVRFHPEHWLDTARWIKLICVVFENAAVWTHPCLVQKKVRYRCLSSGPRLCAFSENKPWESRRGWGRDVWSWTLHQNPMRFMLFSRDLLSMRYEKPRIHDAAPWKVHQIDRRGIWNPLNDSQEWNPTVLEFLLMFSFLDFLDSWALLSKRYRVLSITAELYGFMIEVRQLFLIWGDFLCTAVRPMFHGCRKLSSCKKETTIFSKGNNNMLKCWCFSDFELYWLVYPNTLDTLQWCGCR